MVVVEQFIALQCYLATINPSPLHTRLTLLISLKHTATKYSFCFPFNHQTYNFYLPVYEYSYTPQVIHFYLSTSTLTHVSRFPPHNHFGTLSRFLLYTPDSRPRFFHQHPGAHTLHAASPLERILLFIIPDNPLNVFHVLSSSSSS